MTVEITTKLINVGQFLMALFISWTGIVLSVREIVKGRNASAKVIEELETGNEKVKEDITKLKEQVAGIPGILQAVINLQEDYKKLINDTLEWYRNQRRRSS